MARPKKNNMDYFSHDNGMRNDRKIKAVRARFGLQGYAVYNMLLELLAEADCLIIEWNATEKELIAGDFGITAETLTEMVEYFISIDLMNRQNGWLYSKTFDERSELLFNKRTSDLLSLRSENGINLSETPISETETPENGSLSGINPQSKVKDSKVKKSIKGFTPPTEEDVINYFLENGYSTELAIKVYKYYNDHEWKDRNNNPVKNWKQKMIAVWFKPENKKEAEPFIPKYKNLHDDPTYNLALKQ
jgi:hypothetical protein